MDRLAGGEEWVPWGVMNCGKGQPMQVAHTGHGAAAGPLPRGPGRRERPMSSADEPPVAASDRWPTSPSTWPTWPTGRSSGLALDAVGRGGRATWRRRSTWVATTTR